MNSIPSTEQKRIPPWLRAGWGVFGFLDAPLKTRLIKGLGLMLLPLLILGSVTLYNLRRLDATFHDMIEEITVEKEMLQRLRLHVVQATLTARYYEPGAADNTPLEQDLGHIVAAIDTIVGHFEPDKFALDEEDRLLQDIQHEWQRIRGSGLTLAVVGSGRAREAGERTAFLTGLATINRHLRAVHELAEREVREDIAEFTETRRNTLILTVALFGSGLFIAVGAGILLAGSILRPMGRLEQAAHALARGDFSARVEPGGSDELALLMRTFNLMANELEKSHQALTELAIKDPLTGLYNRREFSRRLGDEIDRAQRYQRPLGLLLLDLDHFKQINDRYGHQAGDAVLRRVAAVLRDALRRVDVLFRLGGEEFGALLPEISAAETTALAERLRATLAATPITTADSGQEQLSVTVSIGAAIFPTHADSGEALFGRADEALYRAKQHGRNRVCSA